MVHGGSAHTSARLLLPLCSLLQAFVPQMHPGMARDDACDRSPEANTPAGGKFTDSYM